MMTDQALTIAVVDDDDDVRTALSRLLRAMGHQVQLFPSAEAFEAGRMPVDCVIVDVRLPGLNGLELRERLRSRIEPASVVLITGDGDQIARNIGCEIDTPLLTKPFDAGLLASAITSAIAMAGSHRERHVH
jgi:FixJ family two-component response regulator